MLRVLRAADGSRFSANTLSDRPEGSLVGAVFVWLFWFTFCHVFATPINDDISHRHDICNDYVYIKDQLNSLAPLSHRSRNVVRVDPVPAAPKKIHQQDLEGKLKAQTKEKQVQRLHSADPDTPLRSSS